jgi:cytochrome c oxidase subunit 2
MRFLAAATPLLATLLSACTGVQSALAPAGADAAHSNNLALVMFAGGTAIVIAVVALAALAIAAPDRRRAWLARPSALVALGIAFPVLVLSALLIYGLAITRSGVRAEGARLRIEVVGEQFWWRVRYLDAEGRRLFATANEIAIPVGETVLFRLESADVIHSFWVPALAGKIDMIPGRTNTLALRADRVGIYRGQCAEFCGAQHANMSLHVVVLEREAFGRWFDKQQQPAPEPALPELARGRQLFFDAGCGACHAVRGTPARGEIGPDLTNVGSRRFLGAGMFPTNVGTLAGWIASSQHLKPENRMPSFNVFTGAELRALADWLDSLK